MGKYLRTLEGKKVLRFMSLSRWSCYLDSGYRLYSIRPDVERSNLLPSNIEVAIAIPPQSAITADNVTVIIHRLLITTDSLGWCPVL